MREEHLLDEAILLILMHRTDNKDLVFSDAEPNLAQGQQRLSRIPSVPGGRTTTITPFLSHSQLSR